MTKFRFPEKFVFTGEIVNINEVSTSGNDFVVITVQSIGNDITKDFILRPEFIVGFDIKCLIVGNCVTVSYEQTIAFETGYEDEDGTFIPHETDGDRVNNVVNTSLAAMLRTVSMDYASLIQRIRSNGSSLSVQTNDIDVSAIKERIANLQLQLKDAIDKDETAKIVVYKRKIKKLMDKAGLEHKEPKEPEQSKDPKEPKQQQQEPPKSETTGKE